MASATPSAMASASPSSMASDMPLTSARAARTAALLLGYIMASASLIRFNKFLMHPDRFPFSMFLTSLHMSASFALCLFLYGICPAAFPGVVNCRDQVWTVMRWMVPLGLSFAISLFTSNQAYIYCSVSFLQFMKEANVIITFLMSCAVGLQVMNRLRMAVIVWIIAGASMAVTGELHFAAVGFAFQLISQLAECARAVMGEMLLGGGGLRLDPLSYTLLVAPTCLLVLSVGTVITWDPAIPGQLAAWWAYILPNCCLAFLLNVLVATIIKEVSAMGFVLVGVCKDILIVLFSCAIFHELVTLSQLFGFAVTLSGIFFWSYMKAMPDGIATMLAMRLLQMPLPECGELVPFAKKV